MTFLRPSPEANDFPVHREPAAQPRLVLSLLPATPNECRVAVAVVLLSLATFAAAVPFARVQLPRVAAFIPGYTSALVINDLITATLLFGQFSITRSRALLVLAGGYLFTALMTVIHALSFPGLFSETGLLGAGVQSTAWLYMFWHGGFPTAVMGYALLKGEGAAWTRVTAPVGILLSVVVVAVLGLVLTGVATAGEPLLPEIMRGNGYTQAMRPVVASVWALSLLALFTLFRRRPHSVLDLWLMVVLCAWLCDVALSAVFNAGRFDLGFYAGRIYGLLAASFVLVVLLAETVTLYARLARAMDAERQEREGRLREMRSELSHVSRLNELGQMVSALAHEVNQPLTAIGNYVRASQRLVQAGDSPRALGALERAGGEATRASEIIRRLRDFIRKGDGEQRPESVGGMIEETVALVLTGAERSDVGVELRLDPDASTARIDKVQIQQVLLNLVRNAIEAMATQPRQVVIIATTLAADGMIEFSVADIGPGLPVVVREKLFQPFVTTKSTGMGVGLSICRSIIEAHGGRLWADDGRGGGAVFRFTVPR
jgi:signal transduction histidine kinase